MNIKSFLKVFDPLAPCYGSIVNGCMHPVFLTAEKDEIAGGHVGEVATVACRVDVVMLLVKAGDDEELISFDVFLRKFWEFFWKGASHEPNGRTAEF